MADIASPTTRMLRRRRRPDATAPEIVRRGSARVVRSTWRAAVGALNRSDVRKAKQCTDGTSRSGRSPAADSAAVVGGRRGRSRTDVATGIGPKASIRRKTHRAAPFRRAPCRHQTTPADARRGGRRRARRRDLRRPIRHDAAVRRPVTLVARVPCAPCLLRECPMTIVMRDLTSTPLEACDSDEMTADRAKVTRS